jgi:hypothetical protein
MYKLNQLPMLTTRHLRVLLLLLGVSTMIYGQAPDDSASMTISSKYLQSVSASASEFEEKLDKKSSKALAKFQKQEAKIRRKLTKIDTLAAANIFANADSKYQELQDRLKRTPKAPYVAKIDSLNTSLNFLRDNPAFTSGINDATGKIDEALSKVQKLKEQLSKAETIKQFLKDRKQYLKTQLSKFGLSKELKKISKTGYYYAQQIEEIKHALKDTRKAEKKALELLTRSKFFKDFMRRNSELASLFRLPGDPGDPSSQANLAGLQTRAQVNSVIQQQIAAGGPGAAQQVSQNLQAAQSQLNQLKDRMLNAGGNSSGEEIPDFKPNNQKTKGFWKRLELGTNVQTLKATNIFPVTSDIGLSVGYKLNDKSIIGIGGSYKMGWGNGWRDIRISHQGLGLRSYVDIKLRGSLWITGGYEQNYRAAFNSITQLNNMSGWQQSGLVGISKVISLRTKLFNKTKIQLLWDLLSYQQVPQTQAIVFRIGYNIK